LPGFKEKSIRNLLESIAASKQVTLSRFIMALGIRHIGVETAELLAKRTGSIQVLSRLSSEQLQHIEGIGEKVALAITEYFADSYHQAEIEQLLNLGVQPHASETILFDQHPFREKTFVLTGTLEHYTRSTAASLIKERGGKVSDTVNKKTDYLIVGQEAGSKLDKGRALGIQILDEQMFTALL
jgi:DNA ligase (NAD+)